MSGFLFNVFMCYFFAAVVGVVDAFMRTAADKYNVDV